MDARRRAILQRGMLGLLAFQVGGSVAVLTPRAARAAQVPLRVLDAAQVRTLEALGDTLLPGAAEAGLAAYLDHQLAADPAESLLMIRYLDVPPPHAPFYAAGLAAVDAAAQKLHGRPFAALEPATRDAFVGLMQRGALEGWQGPPAPFVYFVLRSDAVDVVYGTVEGFEKLGLPYMPHIPPTEKW
jgi:hypothetical protein